VRELPGTKDRFGRLIAVFLSVSSGVTLLSFAMTAGATAGSGGISTGGESDGSNAVFPVRGPHTYGDGLGAGRNHQGQDLLAECGTKIVAARDGRVRVKDFQASGAGNFVVIRRAGTSSDDVYMHMRDPASVAEGEKVEAGEAIGRVGSTGRSTACHLHFEIWSSPGWYSGGKPVDPTPRLKRWDRAT
jgi:murein DD-endopeptidase MepM/ murein hydrolase activator NlpD